jgi:hypothetical protein
MKYNSREFKQLQSDWYLKLRSEGFRDVESESERQFGLITKQSPTYDPIRTYHFQKCSEFLNEFWSNCGEWNSFENVPEKFQSLFRNDLNIFIFDLYCYGATTRGISEVLESNGFKKIHHATVYRRILKILEAANIKPIKLGGV